MNGFLQSGQFEGSDDLEGPSSDGMGRQKGEEACRDGMGYP